MWGLFVGAAAAALAPAGPGALIPLKLAIASADSVGNDVYVAVVVDFGNGSSMSTLSKCVPVPSSGDDADALAAAVGSNNVAYAGSGLLCAIDNYPANGVQNCGQSTGSGDYDYWSYWHGSAGSWAYANNGPAEQSVSNPSNDVEGWRFQLNEPANQSDPAPAVTPSYGQICNASTEVPPAQGSSAPAPPTTTPTTAPPATPTPAASTPVPGAAASPTPAVSTRSKGSSATTTTTTTAQTAPARTTTTTSTDVSGTGDKSRGASGTHRSAQASPVSDKSPVGGSSSGLLPVIVVGVIVVALAGFALFRWRRRPAEE
jgi:hypothetical protein